MYPGRAQGMMSSLLLDERSLCHLWLFPKVLSEHSLIRGSILLQAAGKLMSVQFGVSDKQ